MAAADCGLCEMAGYRSCDECEGPVFRPVPGALRDFCGYCDPANLITPSSAGAS
jgi:hypothetical protein